MSPLCTSAALVEVVPYARDQPLDWLVTCQTSQRNSILESWELKSAKVDIGEEVAWAVSAAIHLTHGFAESCWILLTTKC